MTRANGSANTVTASAKETPCFLWFDSALSGSQVNLTQGIVILLPGDRNHFHSLASPTSPAEVGPPLSTEIPGHQGAAQRSRRPSRFIRPLSCSHAGPCR